MPGHGRRGGNLIVKAADLTGWLDYDRNSLPSLDNGERIAYFEKRVRLVTLNPLT
jgi:hypothetical protein